MGKFKYNSCLMTITILKNLLVLLISSGVLGWEQSRVFLSIMGGIISVDVVELFITQESTWMANYRTRPDLTPYSQWGNVEIGKLIRFSTYIQIYIKL